MIKEYYWSHWPLYLRLLSNQDSQSKQRKETMPRYLIIFSLLFIKVVKSKEKQAKDITLQYKVVNSVKPILVSI